MTRLERMAASIAVAALALSAFAVQARATESEGEGIGYKCERCVIPYACYPGWKCVSGSMFDWCQNPNQNCSD